MHRGEIQAALLTAAGVYDAQAVEPLLEQVEPPVASVSADGAYDRANLYRAVQARAPTAWQSACSAMAPRSKPALHSATGSRSVETHLGLSASVLGGDGGLSLEDDLRGPAEWAAVRHTSCAAGHPLLCTQAHDPSGPAAKLPSPVANDRATSRPG